jgi:L-lactate dehydrogenase complex protein LldF
MKSTAPRFHQNVREALADDRLQGVLEKFTEGFPVKRAAAVARLDEFDDLRDAARDIKNHVLANLDTYLTRFEDRVLENGGKVHWCRDDAEARETILNICKTANARTVTKSKSMIGEEIAINDHLSDNGIEPVETDLGEYIIQLREEPPSHIIAPAIHLSKEQVAETFVEKHTDRDPARALDDPRVMLDEARAELREKFLNADVGLTGANMLVAETGSIAVVTNEGNADLTMGLPRVHIALASIEKIVPTLEDASTVLRVLARSATGQEMSVYTTFATGPKRHGDLDGPEEFHVVLLDNGRSDLLGTEFQDILRCIRCGSCINHCPVYSTVGGHAYGWVYPGPMGSVLTPALIGVDDARHLPNASTLCGKCETVCPMRIPLPRMLRSWRATQVEKNLQAASSRYGLGVWAFMAKRPRLYRMLSAWAARALNIMGGNRGRVSWLPLASGWTSKRDLPAPEGATFMRQWKQRESRYL